jgi:hypothetical protein
MSKIYNKVQPKKLENWILRMMTDEEKEEFNARFRW